MCKDVLIEQFEAELTLTRAVLREVPADDLAWTPHPASFSIGRLAMHVGSIPGWVPAFTDADSYDMGAGGPGPSIPASKPELIEKFAAASDRGRSSLVAVSDAALATAWRLLRDGEVIARMTRAEAISRYVVRHLVHHRGQLTVYLRLRGCVVPAVYGDSADRRLLPPATMEREA